MPEKRGNKTDTYQPEEDIRLILCDEPAADSVAALSRLCAAAKSTAGREIIQKAFQNREKLYACFRSDNPKVRKNTARLLSLIGEKRDVPVLIRQLEEEKTLFVLPSVILALGNTDSKEAERALSNYTVPSSSVESEQKNILETEIALRKARNRFEKNVFQKTLVLDTEKEILLTAPEGFEDILKEELEERGFSVRTLKKGCLVRTADIAELYSMRCAEEILIVVKRNAEFHPESIAKLICKDAQQLPYRIELRGYSGNRTQWLEELICFCGGKNNPSSYAQEFRILVHGEKADIYRKLFTVPDRRYAYRKKTISASMHPALAACIVRYAMKKRGTFTGEESILDPCCGSGTLLFERENAGHCRRLLGADIREETVQIARENGKAGKSKAGFIGKDLKKLYLTEPVDEIYANLPFGNRVGNHKNNLELYAGLAKKLPEWLKPGAFAVLYTMEGKLLKEEVEKIPGLRILEIRSTEAGGLKPKVFYIRKNGRTAED